MPMPVRSLTVLQNWDCSGCGGCCRAYHVPVTAEERKRIEGQGWEKEPGFEGVPFFQKSGGWLTGADWSLNHRADGACVFLGEDNLCRIHAKFGSAGKPLACRVYPFLLVPAGDHWRVGLRFACPSVAQSHGRPLADQLADAREYAASFEESSPAAINAPPIPLQAGQIVPWADLLRIVAVISKTLADGEQPLERRWRKVLGLAALCRGLHFDGGGDAKKMVTGVRLAEMLNILAEAVDEEVPQSADAVPRPGWVGRMVFRPILALYVRKDHGADKGTAQRGPVSRMFAAMSFARGGGRVPKVNAFIPEATFAAAEQPAGPLSPDADAMLTRYYRMKVESLQFCGPTNFGIPFWDGIESLAFTFPAILWQARVLAAGGMPHDKAVLQSLRVVDDNFGFNKLLGQTRQKVALRLLAGRGELPRLIAWYAR